MRRNTIWLSISLVALIVFLLSGSIIAYYLKNKLDEKLGEHGEKGVAVQI